MITDHALIFFVRQAWRVYLTVQVRYGGYQLPTISFRQGCPLWGGIWRKPAANFRSEEHSLSRKAGNIIRYILWISLQNKTKSYQLNGNSMYKWCRYMERRLLVLPREVSQTYVYEWIFRITANNYCEKSAEAIVDASKRADIRKL